MLWRLERAPWCRALVTAALLLSVGCTDRAGPAFGPRVESAPRRQAARSSATSAAVDEGPAAGGRAAGGSAEAAAATAPPPEPSLPQRRDGMLLVPAGSSVIGADEGGEQDEHPAHTVTLAAFYLDETEVTNEAYALAVEAGVVKPPHPRSADVNGFGPDRRFRGARQPVSSISWHDARAYCQWLGKRLPSEAEWERAARGDDGRRYPWGDEPPTSTHACFSASVTAEVGSHPDGRGPFGHLDLAGNVWEWIEDVYDPHAYRRQDAAHGGQPTCEQSLEAFAELRRQGKQGFTGSNPIPDECERVLRGGAFNYHPSGLRSSNRVHHPPRYRLVMSGVRCAADP